MQKKMRILNTLPFGVNHTHLDANKLSRFADRKFNLMNHFAHILIFSYQVRMLRLLYYPTLHHLPSNL